MCRQILGALPEVLIAALYTDTIVHDVRILKSRRQTALAHRFLIESLCRRWGETFLSGCPPSISPLTGHSGIGLSGIGDDKKHNAGQTG
jgi:hypothetical protein